MEPETKGIILWYFRNWVLPSLSLGIYQKGEGLVPRLQGLAQLRHSYLPSYKIWRKVNCLEAPCRPHRSRSEPSDIALCRLPPIPPPPPPPPPRNGITPVGRRWFWVTSSCIIGYWNLSSTTTVHRLYIEHRQRIFPVWHGRVVKE